MKELKVLFGNMYPDNKNYLKFRTHIRLLTIKDIIPYIWKVAVKY